MTNDAADIVFHDDWPNHSADEIETILDAEKTGITLDFDGVPFLSVDGERTRISRPRARNVGRSKSELSFDPLTQSDGEPV